MQNKKLFFSYPNGRAFDTVTLQLMTSWISCSEYAAVWFRELIDIGQDSIQPLCHLVGRDKNIPRNATGGAREDDNVCFTSFVVSPSPASVYPIVGSSSVLDCIAFISLFFMALWGKEIRISEG